MNLFLRLPYRTKTFNRCPLGVKAFSATEMTLSNSSCEIQSVDSTSGSRRNGRYLDLISGASSASDIASSGHCARVRSSRGAWMVPIRRSWELLKVFARSTNWFRKRETIMGDDVIEKIKETTCLKADNGVL